MVDGAGAGSSTGEGSSPDAGPLAGARSAAADAGSAAGGHPVPAAPWMYSPRFVRAVTVALEMHAAQRRKGTTIPYASHLLGTCSIALDYGADEDQAIAAVLHDAIEDIHFAPGAREAVAQFGPEVLRLVLACTDAEEEPKPPWRARKEAYLRHLAGADRAVLLVSAADKLHNARSIVADLRRQGPSAFGRFNPDSDPRWYYRSLVTAYRANPASPRDLVDELDRVVGEMQALAGG